jgi:glycosyltransferase involved in cell wall biosynthesis
LKVPVNTGIFFLAYVFHINNKKQIDMKKVAIIGTAGVPGRYGGFETLAHHLVLNLSKKFKLSVYNSKLCYGPNERPKFWNGARIFYLPFNANGWQSIIYDIISILHALFYADVLIVLGVSGGIIFPFVRLFTNKKIIVNIDGLEWRRDKWNKWIRRFLRFSEKLAVRFSHADITDNAVIKKYTARIYKSLSHQIAYGADHVKKQAITAEVKEQYPFVVEPYAFKVSRIEPENNVHLILQAFWELPFHRLVYVGNWEASEYGRELKLKYGKYKNITLLDPIYDQKQLDVLRSNCYLYIHGHSAGGTNPSLVEAMMLGLPVLAYNVAFNRESTFGKALFFRNKDELKKILTTKRTNQYYAVGETLRKYALKEYTWRVISKKYANIIYSFDYKYKKKHVLPKLALQNRKYLLDNGLAHMKHTLLFYQSSS